MHEGGAGKKRYWKAKKIIKNNGRHWKAIQSEDRELVAIGGHYEARKVNWRQGDKSELMDTQVSQVRPMGSE